MHNRLDRSWDLTITSTSSTVTAFLGTLGRVFFIVGVGAAFASRVSHARMDRTRVGIVDATAIFFGNGLTFILVFRTRRNSLGAAFLVSTTRRHGDDYGSGSPVLSRSGKSVRSKDVGKQQTTTQAGSPKTIPPRPKEKDKGKTIPKDKSVCKISQKKNRRFH
jgi:hypothetical protein